jgi:hypothetical protein
MSTRWPCKVEENLGGDPQCKQIVGLVHFLVNCSPFWGAFTGNKRIWRCRHNTKKDYMLLNTIGTADIN